jgi:hypothetical protein
MCPREPVELGHIITSVYPSMLGTLAHSLLRPHSAELAVPGEATAYKLPGSIDNSVLWADSLDTELLPGEETLPGTGVTFLPGPPAWIGYAPDNGLSVALNQFYDSAAKRFLQAEVTSDRRVSFTCWGSTKCCVFDRAQGRVTEGWYLRSSLPWPDRFTPIVRFFFSHKLRKAVHEYSLSFLSGSHVYSFNEYDDQDPTLLRPCTSPLSVEAASSSAELLARTVRDVAHNLVGQSHVSWEIDSERSPDPKGAIPEMLARFLGRSGGVCV